MTHPKARSKPRPRAARRNQDRIILLAKGRAMLEVLDACAGVNVMRSALARAFPHEQGRATPCAPNRVAPDAPGNKTNKPGTPAARPRTPAAKSGAAPLATKPQASASQPSDTAAQLSEPGTTKPETDE